MRFPGGVEIEASARAGAPGLETPGLIAASRGPGADGEIFFDRYDRMIEPGVTRHGEPVRPL